MLLQDVQGGYREPYPQESSPLAGCDISAGSCALHGLAPFTV